ncbi:MAG TPA: hypothetical protein ENG84_05230 [Gammaproteobacteria bacterium]|nr:hypothetical protein BMS3Abin12_00315 [bacterium BMS3Abin12]HDK03223.1 hypothetical protein [Gammaproteobacteria bacterium]
MAAQDPRDDDTPPWDVALEAVAAQESRRLRRALSIADFHRLAADLDFRTHDFLATIRQLVAHGVWRHHLGEAPEGHPMSEAELERLYVHGRIDEDLAEKFAVTWEPRG